MKRRTRQPHPDQGSLFGTAANAAQPSLLGGRGGFRCKDCHGRGYRAIRSAGQWITVICSDCKGGGS